MECNWNQLKNKSGQEYLIVSVMPTNGQTVDNYKSVAEVFNKAAEVTKKSNVAFGYHNHDSEFEKDNGKVLQDVLLENTHPDAQYGLPAKIKVQIKFT